MRLADPGPGAGCACEVPTADQLRDILFPVIATASNLRSSVGEERNELSILVVLSELEFPELEDVSTTRHLSLNSLGMGLAIEGGL